MEKYPLMVFSDFDGTITEQETLEGFLQLFLDEDVRAAGERMVRAGYTVKQGVQELMARITPGQYLARTDFFDNLDFRAGFGDFLDLLHGRGIPLVVISGGIREMVARNLTPYRDRILDVYAADVDLRGSHVRFWSDYETADEMVGKRIVMERYRFDRSICIGDSYTDFHMAAAGDIVFARDRLAQMLKKSGKPYYEYDTFYDIIEKLMPILEGQG